MSRSEFEQRFGSNFQDAGYLTKSFAFLANLVPDIGPLQRLPIKPLPPNVQQEFGEALGHAVMFLRTDVDDGARMLPNLNLDTGHPHAAAST